MPEFTTILNQLTCGDPTAAPEIVALVYDELKRLAASKLKHESLGNSLQPTALVHEAFMRLMGQASNDSTQTSDSTWENRAHFFAAASEAMRRILVDSARRRHAQKRGGDLQRVDVAVDQLAATISDDQLLAVDEVLDQLAAIDSEAAKLVKLRVFVGFTMDEIAQSLNLSPRTAHNIWTFARAWLRARIESQ